MTFDLGWPLRSQSMFMHALSLRASVYYTYICQDHLILICTSHKVFCWGRGFPLSQWSFLLILLMCCLVPADKTVVICENQGPQEIHCSTGEVISVTVAFYGRTRPDSEVCPYGLPHNDDISCVAIDSEAKIRALCDGKSNCSVPSSHTFYGDPCVGTYKYVNVTYTCIGKIFNTLSKYQN